MAESDWVDVENDDDWVDVDNSEIESAGEPGMLDYLVKGAKAIDSVSGAPTRAAIYAAQNGENPLDAFAENFAGDPDKAATGKMIAAKAGVSDKVRPGLTAAEQLEFAKKYTPGDVKPLSAYKDNQGLSNADLVGGGIDLTADPINLLGVNAIAKGVTKPIDWSAPYLRKVVEKAGGKTAKALEKGGKSLYKSGLKQLDIIGERYGKEPVSDLLMSRGITGSAKDIYRQMDELGDTLLKERKAILKEATRGGAEVDVKAAVKKAQDYVDELRKIDNPEAKNAVKMLQSRIDEYMAAAAKETEQVLRTLPTSEYVPEYRPITGYEKGGDNFIELPAPKAIREAKFKPEVPVYEANTLSNPATDSLEFSGKDLLRKEPDTNFKKLLSEPVIRDEKDLITSLPQGADYVEKFRPGIDVGLEKIPDKINYGPIVPSKFQPGRAVTVLDETERIAGPTPIQTTSWKTTAANKVGDPAWQKIATSSQGQKFDKALSSGLRSETEESVRRILGDDAAKALSQKNSDLGRILTSKERALLDAEQEARRNALTSVDGILSTNPAMLATKKVADLSKTTKFRTVTGKGMVDLSNKISSYLRQTPRLAELEQKNPAAFKALVASMAEKVGAKGAGLPKAAGNEPMSDEESKAAFVEGN